MASLEATPTMRDHRGVGRVAVVGALSLQSSVREGGDGAIRWAGLARTKLHARRDVSWWPAQRRCEPSAGSCAERGNLRHDDKGDLQVADPQGAE
jgi:hypothetical protein